MCETITGRHPFESDSPFGYIYKHINEQPDVQEGKAANEPAWLSVKEVIEQCLSKRPANRWGSAMILRDKLSNVSHGERLSYGETLHKPEIQQGQKEVRAKFLSSLIVFVAIIVVSYWANTRVQEVTEPGGAPKSLVSSFLKRDFDSIREFYRAGNSLANKTERLRQAQTQMINWLNTESSPGAELRRFEMSAALVDICLRLNEV